MKNTEVQTLLLAAGYYNGGIDGSLGEKSWTAINKLLKNHEKDLAKGKSPWTNARKAIAAGQLVLKYAGYEPGAIDGYSGVNTQNALRLWTYKQITGKDEKIVQTPVKDYKPGNASLKFPKQSECNSFYGIPESKGLIAQLKMFTLPVPMRLDYNLSEKSTRLQLHAKCGDSAIRAHEQIVRHYGEADWRKLGLDRNAGTYNPRKMRGGKSWSMHAYGCAEDTYAQPNGLTMGSDVALFAKPIYEAYFNIWEAEGWVSLGRAIGRDWMHVQAARL